jgi:hypothetical protein
MKVTQLYIGHFATLLSGSLLYVLFRTSNLKMFNWFEKLNILDSIQYLRTYTANNANVLPDFILYSLPDGLWLFSYVSLMLYLWKNELNRQNLFWIFVMPVFSFLSELGQLTQLVPGTFDITDLIMYLSAAFLPFIIYKKSITINLTTV